MTERVEAACELLSMQIIGKPVRYREAGSIFTALITGVTDEERGFVNLAVFSDSGCINRYNIPPGSTSGRWETLPQKQALVDLGPSEAITRELVTLHKNVARLEAGLTQAMTLLSELAAKHVDDPDRLANGLVDATKTDEPAPLPSPPSE